MSTEGTLLWASQLPIIIPPIDSSYLVVRDFSLPLSDVERDAEFKPPGRRVQLEALGGGGMWRSGISACEDIFIAQLVQEKSRRAIFTTQGEKPRGSRIKLVLFFFFFLSNSSASLG